MPIEDFFEKVDEPETPVEEGKEPETPVAASEESTEEEKEEIKEGTEEESPEEGTKGPEESKEEDLSLEDSEGAPDVPDGTKDSEVQSLRTLLREQGQELAEARARSLKLEEKLTSSGIIEDGDLDTTVKEGVSDERRASLAILAETMQMNPAYKDFEKVLDQTVFDETVLAMAKHVVANDGGRLSDRLEEVSDHIWGLPNPYKYMYDIIKASHPAFKVKEKKVEKPTEGPPSLQNLPGGSSGKDGWTAAKIDKLEEDELDTVPPNVYEKYMQGALA